ncbi:MAG: hypothetical protein JJT96_20000 [Opitutales bacterium]|nr:hypothetical protein [Opitutales bacterium]
MRRLCLNIVREAQRVQEKRVSVPRLLRRCAMTDEHLLEVLQQGMPVYANAPSAP